MKTADQIQLELTQENCTKEEASLVADLAKELQESGTADPWGFEQLKENLGALRSIT